MPIDPTAQAASLIAAPTEISPIEQQNRYGVRHQTISDLTAEKFVTVLVIQTPESFSESQFFEILSYLRENYGVETMQTPFAATVPHFGQEYRNDLHLTAHLRVEATDDENA